MDRRARMVKIFILKLSGTLSGNATLTMPASTTGGNANRVFFVEDGTTRGRAGDSQTVTLSVLTGQVVLLKYLFLQEHL